jgi:hypothetical protein
MTESLRALLTGVIDYAGLFPPAQLPLEEALRNYAAYRESPDSWMLARFVCPAAKLAELDPIPVVAIVGRGGIVAPDFFENMKKDWHDMHSLRRRALTAIGGYEVRVCDDVLHSEQLSDLQGGLLRIGFSLPTFLEAEYGPRWTASVEKLLAVGEESYDRRTGLKIRCGGATAASVPSSAHVAFALVSCRKAGVAVKFTAGLHHPLRRHDSSLGTMTHGFLNVFVAGVLSHTRGCDADVLESILEDEDPKHFAFDDAGLRWKALQATTDEIRVARETAVISFGSCSFDEPREDLRALGLME